VWQQTCLFEALPLSMVKSQTHVITYSHPFAAVTSSLWSKYDNHKYVKNIEIISRHVDEHGRLHSLRLLSMGGNIPSLFAAFVPMKCVHMLETVVVDPVTQTMTVETANVNCQSVVDARSRSRYTPSPDSTGSTKYEISIAVRAFPILDNKEAAATPTGSHDAAGFTSAAVAEEVTPTTASSDASGKGEWKVEIVSGRGSGPAHTHAQKADTLLTRLQQGYIAGKLESWVANKLLSNVSKGEKYIDGFCRRWCERHTMLCERAESGGSAGPLRFPLGPETAGFGNDVAIAGVRMDALSRGEVGLGQDLDGRREFPSLCDGIKEAVSTVTSRQLRLSRFLSRHFNMH